MFFSTTRLPTRRSVVASTDRFRHLHPTPLPPTRPPAAATAARQCGTTPLRLQRPVDVFSLQFSLPIDDLRESNHYCRDCRPPPPQSLSFLFIFALETDETCSPINAAGRIRSGLRRFSLSNRGNVSTSGQPLSPSYRLHQSSP